MEQEKIIEAVTTGVKAALEARAADTKAFRVPAEEHWKHHKFLDGALEFFADSRKIIWRIVLGTACAGFLSLIGLGIAAFIYLKSGGPT